MPNSKKTAAHRKGPLLPDVFRMTGSGHYRALLPIFVKFANPYRGKSNGAANLVCLGLDRDGLVDLRCTNVGNVDIDACACLFQAMSRDGKATTPVYNCCLHCPMYRPSRIHVVRPQSQMSSDSPS